MRIQPAPPSKAAKRWQPFAGTEVCVLLFPKIRIHDRLIWSSCICLRADAVGQGSRAKIGAKNLAEGGNS
jgi:hypothetical protein